MLEATSIPDRESCRSATDEELGRDMAIGQVCQIWANLKTPARSAVRLVLQKCYQKK